MAKILLGMVAALILAAMLFASAEAQGFGTKGVSSRELPKGICVIEVDEVIEPPAQISTSGITKPLILDLIITETGRKPSFAKVQSLWLAAEPEDLEDQLFQSLGSANLGSGKVAWDGMVRIAARTIAGTPTGVPAKTLILTPGARQVGLLSGSLLAMDFVPSYNTFAGPPLTSNGLPIPSQGVAGEISIRFAFIPDTENRNAYDFHAIAVIESPVGNLCSMNLVPVRDRGFEQALEGGG